MKTPQLSHPQPRLSTKRVIFVPSQVYIEGRELVRGQGPSHLEAWRDLLPRCGTSARKYKVPSKSRSGMFHVIDLSDPDFPKCGCENFFYNCLTPDGEYITGKICGHIERKAEEILQAKKGRK